MQHTMKRIVSLSAALMLTANCTAFAESEASTVTDEQQLMTQDEHFVPENPDMENQDVKLVELSLADRIAATDKGVGSDIDGGVLFEGGAINKCVVPLPYTVMKGQHVKLTITGRFESERDKGLQIYLTNSAFENCSNATAAEIKNDGTGRFSFDAELISNKECNGVMLATPLLTARFHGVVIESVVLKADADLLAGIDPSVPYAEAVKQDWYQTMLKDAQVNLGNNKRLKAVVERLQDGEDITIATIGGSITEGAGANRYQECYAYRIYDGFKQAYQGERGSVSFVNAGVGGTPSTFGWMRYQRDIVDRVNDNDGLPDIVVIEYSVNDGGEPTNHQCFESMVKQILMQPNEPVVIILFAVFPTGYNLQADLRKIGDVYDLMMVSIKDGPFKQVGSKWTEHGFFYDQYHPTTLGHAVMADCVLTAIEDALALPESEQDINLNVAPAYGVNYMGIQTIYKHGNNTAIDLDVGGFSSDDANSYSNLPIGRVCGANFFHRKNTDNAPLTFTATFKNLLIAYRTMNDASYGKADVYIDGKKVRTLNANTGSWGQSVVDLLYSSSEAAEHTVSVCMASGDEAKQFTITCFGYTPE